MAILKEGSDYESEFGSSSTAAEEDDVGGNKHANKRLKPSQSEQGLGVPSILYDIIQDALAIEKLLVTNKNDEGLTAQLRLVEKDIEIETEFFKSVDLLPSDWKYNPATAHTCWLKKLEKDKKTKKIKTEKGPPNPYINYNPLNASELETWLKFKEVDKAAGYNSLSSLSYENLQNDSIPVKEEDPVKSLVGDFAVMAFNKSYQLYVNKDNNKNLSDARFMECKYIKFEEEYLFYLTIEAIEQGNLGVYETAIEFKSDDGARALDMFALTNHEPSGQRRLYKFLLFGILSLRALSWMHVR